MTRSRVFAMSASVLVALVGCSTAGPPEVRSGSRPPARSLPAFEVPVARDGLTEPEGEVTLRDALSLVIRQNPGLAADSWEIRAREADALQAGRRPRPELEVELENLAGSGPFSGLDVVETTVALSQVIELGGKRTKRLADARLDRDLAVWDYEVRRVNVLTETVDAFVETLAAQEQLALADMLVSVAEDVLVSVTRRVDAGGASPVEARRARVSLETSRVDRQQLFRALTVARARLSGMWDGSSPAFSRVAGSLEISEDSEVPGLDLLLSRMDHNPEIARWTTELDRRRASRELARAAGVPDITLGGGVRHFNEPGETALVVGISLPLPLFDRNRDATDAAEHRVQRAREERRGAEVRIRTALETAHAALVATSLEASALRDRVLPEADLARIESQQAYVAGRLRLTDVLDAQRSAFELRERYVEVLTTHHRMVAEIERLLGTPLHEDMIRTEGR